MAIRAGSVMRISVNKHDHGFVPDAYMYTVFFNNERRDDCFTADEEAGLVWVFRPAPLGAEVLYGKVRIVRDSILPSDESVAEMKQRVQRRWWRRWNGIEQ